jgi:hypothetical protein
MSEVTDDKKSALVLDTDWVTAVALVLGSMLCGAAAIYSAKRILAGVPATTQVTSQTWLLLAVAGVLFASVRNRTVRFGLSLLALSAISRIALSAAGASMLVQRENAEVMRVVMIVVLAGACVYAIVWLTRKVQRA